MRIYIFMVMMMLLCLNVVSATLTDFKTFNNKVNEDNWFNSLFSTSGDKTCCYGCQPTSSGTILDGETKTVDCGGSALIDFYIITSANTWYPVTEKTSPYTFACTNTNSRNCVYECYNCNLGGTPEAGLDLCTNDYGCQLIAKDKRLPAWENYVCENNGCHQNCNAVFGEWSCDGADLVRTGTRAQGCSDPNPIRTIPDSSLCAIPDDAMIDDGDVTISPNSYFIGLPSFTPKDIKAGDSITITQKFHADIDGTYMLEAGSEYYGNFLSFVGISKNECNINEAWYSNKKVALTKGEYDVTFVITPKSINGQHKIHTSYVKGGCGSDDYINYLAEDYVNVSGGQDKSTLNIQAYIVITSVILGLLLVIRWMRKRK